MFSNLNVKESTTGSQLEDESVVDQPLFSSLIFRKHLDLSVRKKGSTEAVISVRSRRGTFLKQVCSLQGIKCRRWTP